MGIIWRYSVDPDTETDIDAVGVVDANVILLLLNNIT